VHFKYFKYEEFDSPDVQGSGQMVDDRLIMLLDAVREEYGRPIRVSSGFRTEEANHRAGGVSNSSHLRGLAADLKVRNSKERYELLRILLKHFNRIGVGKGFIHVDIDSAKTPNVVWTY